MFNSLLKSVTSQFDGAGKLGTIYCGVDLAQQ
jgi:hypothetical protein